MTTLIVFMLGYALGGATALVILGLAVAARNGDRMDERHGRAARRQGETR